MTRMNCFISSSPNAWPHAPTKPPPNPFVPATPSAEPFTRTVVPSPSSTIAPADSIARLTSRGAPAW